MEGVPVELTALVMLISFACSVIDVTGAETATVMSTLPSNVNSFKSGESHSSYSLGVTADGSSSRLSNLRGNGVSPAVSERSTVNTGCAKYNHQLVSLSKSENCNRYCNRYYHTCGSSRSSWGTGENTLAQSGRCEVSTEGALGKRGGAG